MQEETKAKLDKLNEIIVDLEKDNVELSVLINNEEKNRIADSEQFQAELLKLQNEVDYLSTQVGISEEELATLTKKIEDSILVELNKASIQKKHLEDDLADLKYEFDNYKETTAKELKSAKSTAMIGIAAAVISIVISIINMK